MYGLPDSWAGYAAKKLIRHEIHTSASSMFRDNGFTFKFSGLKLDKAKLNAYLHTPSGDLWRYMERQGRQATAAAKRQVGVKTGKLRNSISMSHYGTANGQVVKIGSDVKYAYLHHQGTKPHIIKPDRAPVIRFSSGSRVIYSREIMHPGTRPNRYLSDQLKYFRG